MRWLFFSFTQFLYLSLNTKIAVCVKQEKVRGQLRTSTEKSVILSNIVHDLTFHSKFTARHILIQNTKTKPVHLNFCSFSLQEAGNINRSLSCLGQVITALVDVGNGKQRHVCYRDSKLTFLLRVKQIIGFWGPFMLTMVDRHVISQPQW